MRVIKTHPEHIKDLELSIARENIRLDYLNRVKSGQENYAVSKKDLESQINIQIGKLLAYQDALEMAKAFSKYDTQDF